MVRTQSSHTQQRSTLLLSVICALAFLTGCALHRHQVSRADGDRGKVQFQSYCAGCHADDGQGVETAPPLAGSEWVNGPEERLIKIVLHGVRGTLEVKGKTYAMEMPGFGHVLSNDDVASLLSFVRNRFGAPSGPIAPAMVRDLRASNASRNDYWNVEELLRK